MTFFTSLDLAFLMTSGFYVDWLSVVDKEHLSAYNPAQAAWEIGYEVI